MKKDFLYKTAEKIWERLIKRSGNGKWYSAQVKENLEKLYPFAGREKEREYYIRKIKFSLQLCVTGFLLAAGIYISERLQPLIRENRIYRQGYSGTVQNIPVEVLADGKKQYEFELEVRERMYSQKQLRELYERAAKELEAVILGENISPERVETDLNLVEELPGYPFWIAWESGNYNVIDAEGKLRGTAVSKEGEPVSLNAVFTCENFRAEHLYYVQVYPKTLTEEEQKELDLLEAVKKAEEESREEEAVLLPAESDGKRLLWRSRRTMTWPMILLGTVCAAVFVYFLRDEDLRKEMRKRENQMLLTYPEAVSKLSIYLGAGMTLKAAWEKISANYEREKAVRGRNLVYEEMNIVCQEMKSGIPEITAYERFGKRCGIRLYSKFSALLIQNLKKGSTKLSALLKEESRFAFEERKNAARKAGEEAGTKLLLPMMMMLCVVMLMILLPAFMTF